MVSFKKGDGNSPPFYGWTIVLVAGLSLFFLAQGKHIRFPFL